MIFLKTDKIKKVKKLPSFRMIPKTVYKIFVRLSLKPQPSGFPRFISFWQERFEIKVEE
jgi:hypothetical protein